MVEALQVTALSSGSNPQLQRSSVLPLHEFLIAAFTRDERVWLRGYILKPRSELRTKSAALVALGQPWWPQELVSIPRHSNLDELGLRAEELSWVTPSLTREHSEIVVAAVLDFQMRETLLEAGDHFPLRWNVVGWQAIVAAYNATCAAIRTGAGNDERSTFAAVTAWLKALPDQRQVECGDLHLFHHFDLVLSRFLAEVSSTLHEAQSELVAVQRAVFGRRWHSRRGDLRKLTERIESLQRIEPALGAIVSEWQARDPLSNASTFGASSALSVRAVLAAPRDRGFQLWAVRRAVASAQATNETAGVRTGIGQALREALEHTISPAVNGSDDKWHYGLFVLRALQQLAPSAPDVADELEFAGKVTREQWERGTVFLSVWHHLRTSIEGLGSANAVGPEARLFAAERGALFTDAQERLDRWHNVLCVLALGPLTPNEFSNWASWKQSYFRESRALVLPANATMASVTEEMWQRHFELLNFFVQWATVCPSVEEVRTAVRNERAVESSYEAFFALWLNLRVLAYAAPFGSRHEQFKDAYWKHFPQGNDPLAQKIDLLRGYLQNVIGVQLP